MNSRRLYTKYQGFIFPLVLIALAVALFSLVIVPATQQTIGMFQDSTTIEDEVAALTKKLNVLEGLDENTLRNNLVAVTSAIPIDKSLPTILHTIDGIGSQSQVTIKDVQILTSGNVASSSALTMSTQEKQFGTFFLPFTVTVTGSFDQIQAFLQLSTQVRRLVRAKAFSLNLATTVDTSKTGGPSNALSTQVLFDAFFSPVAQTNAGADIQPFSQTEQKTLTTVTGIPNVGDITMADTGQSLPAQPTKANPFAQ